MVEEAGIAAHPRDRRRQATVQQAGSSSENRGQFAEDLVVPVVVHRHRHLCYRAVGVRAPGCRDPGGGAGHPPPRADFRLDPGRVFAHPGAHRLQCATELHSAIGVGELHENALRPGHRRPSTRVRSRPLCFSEQSASRRATAFPSSELPYLRACPHLCVRRPRASRYAGRFPRSGPSYNYLNLWRVGPWVIANHPAAPLLLREGDRQRLTRLIRSTSVRAGLAQRARIMLLAADGVSNTEIAEKVGAARTTVIAWRAMSPVVGRAGELQDPARHREGDPVSGQLTHVRVEPFPGRFACER